MAYWTERIDQQSNRLYDKTQEETDKKLAQYYQYALAQTQIEVERLYAELVVAEVMTASDLYRYDRFYTMRNHLRERLIELGNQEIEVLGQKFQKMYTEVQNIIDKQAPEMMRINFAMPGNPRKVLESVWCADGKLWSDRVWNNMAKLQDMVEQGLIDCVVTGKSKDKVVLELKKEFGVGFNQADRIVRTELNYIQNQAAADRYKAMGFDKYQILAMLDERTSKICEAQNGKVYQFAEMQVGVNFPPFHPNCRTTIIPDIKG